MGFYKALAVLLGIAASLLIVLSVAVFEGWMPASLVDNLTSTELATIAALAIVGAGGAYVYDRDVD